MKKIKLLLFTILCLLVLSNNVSAANSKSGNYFNCDNANYQCISCTYNEATYYAKSDGAGKISISWETKGSNFSKPIAKNADSSSFCAESNCNSLGCPASIYSYPDSKGNTVYTVDEPTSQYKAVVNKTNGSDNGKPFISDETKKDIEEGKKYSSLTCEYNTYTAKQGSSTPTKSTSKDFVVKMETDGSFTITYKGNTVSNASTLAGSGNITTDNFSKGTCPDIYASCETNNNKIICSASTTDIYYGNQDASGEKESTTVVDPESNNNTQTSTQTQKLSTGFLDICDKSKNPRTLAAFKLAGILIFIAKIIVPIILIVMGMIDMSKAVVEGKDDSIQKSFINFLKRAIAGALVFLAPTIILAIFNYVDGWSNTESSFKGCLNCLLKPATCEGSITGNSTSSSSNANPNKSNKPANAEEK